MDTFSHAAWGYAVLSRLPARVAVAGAIAGAAPDLLFFIPSKVEQIAELGWRRGLSIGGEPGIWRAEGPPLPPELVEAYWRYYVWTHSLLVLAAALAVGWVVARRDRRWLWLGAPYAMHILMDIPTHERYRTQPFYPLWDWQFPGLSWGDPRIFWPHLIVLVSVYVWLWNGRRRAAASRVEQET
jgi:membrane-bound metal-dependent hydrolase YbcI (DUF457 family)